MIINNSWPPSTKIHTSSTRTSSPPSIGSSLSSTRTSSPSASTSGSYSLSEKDQLLYLLGQQQKRIPNNMKEVSLQDINGVQSARLI